jgi:hypothetical protein
VSWGPAASGTNPYGPKPTGQGVSGLTGSGMVMQSQGQGAAPYGPGQMGDGAAPAQPTIGGNDSLPPGMPGSWVSPDQGSPQSAGAVSGMTDQQINDWAGLGQGQGGQQTSMMSPTVGGQAPKFKTYAEYLAYTQKNGPQNLPNGGAVSPAYWSEFMQGQ